MTADDFRATVRQWCRTPRPHRLACRPDRGRRRGVRRLPEGVVRRTAPAPATPSRTGRPNGAAACRSTGRSCSTPSWPPTTPRAWCWRSSASITPRPPCWSPAPTSSAAATCPPSSTARSGCRGSPNPRPDRIWPACAPRRAGSATHFVVNGQKLWASGGLHADWCLLLARTDPDAPKRNGISYFLLDMTTPGIDVRPIRNAIGDSHFCEIFLNDVEIPAGNLVGAENARLAGGPGDAGRRARHDDAGAGRAPGQCGLPVAGASLRPHRTRRARPLDDAVVRDRLAQFEIEITGLRGLCRDVVVEDSEAGTVGAGRRLGRQAVLQRAAAADDRLRCRDRWAGRADRTGQAGLQRLGVRLVDAGLHRILGMDHSRRVERDPAHHHRRARPWPAARAERGSDGTDFAGLPRRTAFGGARSAGQGHASTGRCSSQAGWVGLEVPEHFGGAVRLRRSGRRLRGDGPGGRVDGLPRRRGAGCGRTECSAAQRLLATGC